MPRIPSREKAPLLANGLAPPSSTQESPRYTIGFLRFVGIAAALIWFGLWSHAGLRPDPRGASHKLRYAGEKIAWHECGKVEEWPVECSSIEVPMDQFNATNSGNKTFVIPLIRLRGRNATKNLVLNPGGPGGSGFEFMHRRGKQLRDIVGEGFHLLSFDPRGVNGSRPQALCYKDYESRVKLSPVRDMHSAADMGEMYAWAQNKVRACEELTGEHGAYLNTPQTAADMNNILDAVGQEDMVYWGFSYGTMLGQTYATMFPERSARVIIDGVGNEFDWYGSEIDREEIIDTPQVWKGFLEECWKAGDNCSLTARGKPMKVGQELADMLEDLRTSPIPVYINSTSYGLLTHNDLWNGGIFLAMYKPPTWYALAERLAQLLDGNATEAFLAYHQTAPANNNQDDAERFVELNDRKSGPKYWKGGLPELQDAVGPYLKENIFAECLVETYFHEALWRVPRTHSYEPVRGVKTAHPLLILSTTYDPICPLVSARSAADAFVGSRLVELKGYGHCSVSMPSLCMARHVRSFLYNGTMPEEGAQCEVDGPYFIKPDEKGETARAFIAAEDPEEQRIHRAQVQLAQDLWF